jgi:hypothetical protein
MRANFSCNWWARGRRAKSASVNYLREDVRDSAQHKTTALSNRKRLRGYHRSQLYRTLCRNLIEASILISYIAEDDVSPDELACRRLVFYVHDCASRVRVFKGLKAKEQYAQQKETLDMLKKELDKNTFFKTLSDEQRSKAIGGMTFYLGGLRKAAVKAGWNEDEFDAIYAYLSAQPHSTPMSHISMAMNSVDFKTVSLYQMAFAGVALEQGHKALRGAAKQICRIFPDVGAALGK